MAPIATSASNMKVAGVSSDDESKAYQNIICGPLYSGATPCPIRAPLVVVIAGHPCRGKSLASHKIARQLCWKGENAKVFQVENSANADTLKEISTWFEEGNNVAIIDGLHLTRQSRQFVSIFCSESVYHYLIIEFNCDEKNLHDNIKDTAKFYERLHGESDWTAKIQAKVDLYQGKLEPCTALEGPLIIVNNSENPMYHSVTAKGVQGPLQTSILGKLASPVIRSKIYYFSRHGESEYNVLGRIGGDADLSPRGRKYAERLTRQLGSGAPPGVPAPKLIWTSEYQRTIHTVQDIPGPRAALKELNEINAGICEGLTYEEIQEKYPTEFAWRDQDKLKYRYPHGESYLDLLQRVEDVVQALLTTTETLIVSHQAVLRCIMAYFKGTSPEDIPYINVPLHTLLVVKSYGYNYEIETIPLKVECVDTYRIQPKDCSIARTNDAALTTVPAHFDTPLSQTIS